MMMMMMMITKLTSQPESNANSWVTCRIPRRRKFQPLRISGYSAATAPRNHSLLGTPFGSQMLVQQLIGDDSDWRYNWFTVDRGHYHDHFDYLHLLGIPGLHQTNDVWLVELAQSFIATYQSSTTNHPFDRATPRHWGTPEPWNERPLEWKVFAMLAVQNAGISFPSIQGARSLAGTSGDAPRHRHVAVHAVARTTRSRTGPSLTDAGSSKKYGRCPFWGSWSHHNFNLTSNGSCEITAISKNRAAAQPFCILAVFWVLYFL